MEQGWRTLYVENAEKLRLRDGCLLAEGETAVSIPLEQLHTVLIDSTRTTMTAALLAELCEKHIAVILCNGKHQPVGEWLGFSNHCRTAERLAEQCAWTAEGKAQVWKTIVERKLQMQCALLKETTGAVPTGLYRCLAAVLPNDRDNREGIAAGLYFRALFGSRFHRHTGDETNAALNYGYTVLRTAMERILVTHGYQTAMGLHHCSGSNPHNLSCDLMEPFRPVVDRLVCREPDRDMDRERRQELARIRQTEVGYGADHCTLTTAMERFAMDVLAVLRGEKRDVKEVRLNGAA